MPIDWTPFVEFVQGHRRFLLTTHVRPDGDGIGSLLALAAALEALGKNVRTLIASTYPPRYAFLDPARRIRYFEGPGDEDRDADAVIVIDTGTWNQLGSFGQYLQKSPAARAVIDHHLTQDDLGGLRLVDATAEASGRLARQAIAALGVPLTAGMASNLFVALAMDTGWFRHSNATAATFALASELVAAGARPDLLYDELFERNSPARLRLIGLVLQRLTVELGGKVAHTELRRGDYEATGATPQDSEDLVNYTRSVQGVEVGVFFMEQPRGGVKVSFRSRGAVDVARLAETFGGGGHRQASGVILPNASLDEARALVLPAVARALDSSRQQQ